MNKEYNISKLLKQNLEGYESFVDAGQWDVLSARLNAYDRKRILLLWSNVVVGFIILLLFSTAFFNSTKTEKPHSKSMKNNSEKTIVDVSPEVFIPNPEKPIDRNPKNASTNPDFDQSQNEDHSLEVPKGSTDKDKGVISEMVEVPYESMNHFEKMFMLSKIPAFSFEHPFTISPPLPLPLEKSEPLSKNKTEPINGKWELGIMTTPSVANKILNSDKTNGWLINRDFFGITEKSEKRSGGFQSSFAVQFNLNSIWFLQGGLTYSEKRESVSYNHIIKDEIIVSQTEKRLIYNEAPRIQWIKVSGSGINKYTFIELPLFVGFKHKINDKLEWRSRGGVSYWRLIDKQGTKIDPTILTLNNLSDSKDYTKSNLGFAINSGFYYNLSPAMKFLVETGASMAMTNLTKGSPVITKPYSYGLNVGIQYIIIK